MKDKVALGLYACISALILGNEFIANQWLGWIVKPFMMPALILVFTSDKLYEKTSNKLQLIVALIFSWGGDVLLMLTGKYPILFIAGLVSFLIAHVFYISIFAASLQQLAQLRFIGWKATPALLYIAVLLSILIPALQQHPASGILTPSILAYALVIGTMLLTALNRKVASTSSYRWVLVGAVLFVLSDSMIAINRFVSPFAGAGFAIMSTYLVAQYMIVKGHLKSSE